MPNKISKKEVEDIVKLARLELSEDEVSTYTDQLSGILEYIDQLQEVDTDNVAITTQVTGLSNVMREDEIKGNNTPEELIKLAPEHENNLVKVKAVFSAKD